jgi:hypothetical protein
MVAVAEYHLFPQELPIKELSMQFTDICDKSGSFQELLDQIMPVKKCMIMFLK